MNVRLLLPLLLVFAISAVADPHPGDQGGARNKDGSFVSGVLSARFDPSNLAQSSRLAPFPTSLFFVLPEPTTDLTINIPVADPTDVSNPTNALNALDGFSTTEKWVMSFSQGDEDSDIGDFEGTDGEIDPATVIPGQSVRVFQVTTQQFVFVTGILRELTPGVEYTAVASGGNLAIIPLQPLPEYSDFMAVVTNDVTDLAGNNATPSTTYHLTKADEPWFANGQSTYPLIPDANAAGLEGLRQITATMEGAAAQAGINPDDIVLSWTVHTQSITPTLGFLRSITEPGPVIAAPTPFTTADVGGAGIADIIIGVITVPYYHGIPSAENPAAPLTEFWRAAPGGYLPPFDQLGLDPTSTNLTVANPIPVVTGTQTVPLIMTVPNANSGLTKPASGWPVAIYMPSLTRNRTDVLALADALASVGVVAIAIDQPMHGVVPAVEPQLAPFYIENTPFAPIANERTFDLDFFNNETGVFGPDGVTDPSGSSYFNLANLRAVRDYLRQAQADFLVLAASIPNIDVDGDQVPDLDSCSHASISTSAGSFAGMAFAALEPCVTHTYINVAGGQALRSAEAGAFGVRIRAGLAAVGVLPGTPQFEQFMTVGTTVLDSADSANWAKPLVSRIPVIHNTVIDDDTVPNVIPGAPLAGNEGLNRIMGLESYSTTQANPDGVRGVARFLPPAGHSSLFRPDIFPAATVEMQTQMASFVASRGTFVQVSNPEILVPVIDLMQALIGGPVENRVKDGGKDKARTRDKRGPFIFKRPGE